MPYKNPERKRQWEQNHRMQRTKRRRLRRPQQHNQPGEAPVLPEKNRRGTWWVLFFGVAAIFLALGVLRKTGSGRRNPIAAKSSGAISEKNLWTKLTRTFLQHDGEFAGSGELARGDCRHRGGFGWRPRRRVISISSAWSL